MFCQECDKVDLPENSSLLNKSFARFKSLMIIIVQCTPDLVTHLVCQKTVTKSRGVTK